jgi:hypothetical protein
VNESVHSLNPPAPQLESNPLGALRRRGRTRVYSMSSVDIATFRHSVPSPSPLDRIRKPKLGDAGLVRADDNPKRHSALEPAVVEQFARAAQQGDPPSHRRRRHFPRPRLDRPPRRRASRRATRRVGRVSPLHERRVDREGARASHRGRRGGDGHHGSCVELRRGDQLSAVHHLMP